MHNYAYLWQHCTVHSELQARQVYTLYAAPPKLVLQDSLSLGHQDVLCQMTEDIHILAWHKELPMRG